MVLNSTHRTQLKVWAWLNFSKPTYLKGSETLGCFVNSLLFTSYIYTEKINKKQVQLWNSCLRFLKAWDNTTAFDQVSADWLLHSNEHGRAPPLRSMTRKGLFSSTSKVFFQILIYGHFLGRFYMTRISYPLNCLHYTLYFRDLKTGERIRRWGQGEYIHQQYIFINSLKI